MNIYLVGGAVRDHLLNLPVHERDWVVVGAMPADMLKLGYKQVGKEFPVFLHPKTAEEYALARRERKVAPGYTGFVFDTSPQVTLEEDLLRRDLTINAMAQSEDGALIDPYGGQLDLEKRILRHVSPAFAEDPVRILRVARFAARYSFLGFTVANETKALMREMVSSGEVDALVAERVWKELERALGEKAPEVFFIVLADCGALEALFPSIKLDAPGMKALKEAVKLTQDPVVRFAALMHDARDVINPFCDRYRLPSENKELAQLVARHYETVLSPIPLSGKEILAVLLGVDAFRREERFNKFLLSCQAIAKARNLRFSQDLEGAYKLAKQVDIRHITDNLQQYGFLKGPELGRAINEERINRIEKALLSKENKE